MKKRPLPPLLLREKHVEELLPFSHSYHCALRKTGDFPAGEPLFPGSRARVWTWSAVRKWLESRFGAERGTAVLADYLMLFFGLEEHEVKVVLGKTALSAEPSQPTASRSRPGLSSARRTQEK
jgi:predicted DNA-binding transcriptional regulator AlpA